MDERRNVSRINYLIISTEVDTKFDIYISNSSSEDTGELCSRKNFVYEKGDLKYSCYRNSFWGRYIILKNFQTNLGCLYEIRAYSYDQAPTKPNLFKFVVLSRDARVKDKYSFEINNIDNFKDCSGACYKNPSCMGFSYSPCRLSWDYPTLTRHLSIEKKAFVARAVSFEDSTLECLD